jgi:hypothetical protein
VEAYNKGGHVVTFSLEHGFEAWSEGVYDVLACAQLMCGGWYLSGFIEEEFDLTSTDCPIPGIDMVTCFCPRPGTSNYK